MSEGANEFVYGGCPKRICSDVNYITAQKWCTITFFMAKRSMDNLHEYQKRTLDYG